VWVWDIYVRKEEDFRIFIFIFIFIIIIFKSPLSY
jgi:hypothetical protein